MVIFANHNPVEVTMMCFRKRYHEIPLAETCVSLRKRTEKWSGSVVSAATETWINDMYPLPETHVNRCVSATLSCVSATFQSADSWHFVLCQSLSRKIFQWWIYSFVCRLEYLSRIMENGFLWRKPEKNLSSPERISFHSVATVWFSFHLLFWLLRKKGFNMRLPFVNWTTLLVFKVAPYSFSIPRALMTKAQVICARSKKNISSFRFLWRQHEHKKAKLTATFLAFPSVNPFKTWKSCNHMHLL